MGDFGKTEEDREAHKLEPLNEENDIQYSIFYSFSMKRTLNG